MNSLLSPGKPVLTRFKVPGEGAYTLSAELHAPLPRHVALPSSNSSNKSAAAAAPSPPPAGPLGLASVTTVSFVRRTSLAAPPPDPAPPTAPAQTPAPPAPAAPSPSTSTSGSGLFSLRKLTGLGSTISSKFGAATTTVSDPSASSSTASGSVDDAPLSARSWVANALSSTPSVVSNATSDPSPRAPPRAALLPRPESAPDGTGAKGGAKAGTKSSLTAAPKSRTASDAQDDVADEGLPPPLGVLVYNASDCVLALDLPVCGPPPPTPERNPLDPSLTLNVRSPPTAHALQMGEKLQLLVGCANGEVVYYPDISATAAPADGGKRTRGIAAAAVNGGPHPAYYIYNRDGTANGTRVVAVRWVPTSGYRFIAVHVDGAIAVYDSRLKPHTNAFRTGPPPPSTSDSDAASATGSVSSASTGASTAHSLRPGARDAVDKPGADKPDIGRERDKGGGGSGGSGSEKSAVPGHRRTGSAVAGAGSVGQHEITVTRSTRRKSNPLAVWQVGCGILTDAAFAPGRPADAILLAVSGRDGYLRVLDFSRETPLIAFRSYFGALLCVAWSPDGRFVAAAGEDDLVSVWCPAENRIVARLEGHTSWVSAVAWDASVAGPARYRLASAGQDTKLLLWDFDVDMLHTRHSHARMGATNMVRLRSYAREPVPPAAATATEKRTGKLARLRGSAHSSTHGSIGSSDADGNGATPTTTATVVGALGRAEVPVVGPVVAHVAHAEPLTHVCFQDFGILTADSAGNVKLWTRPPLNEVAPISLGNKDAVDGGGKLGGKRTQRNADLD